MANEKNLELSTLQGAFERYDNSLADVAKSGDYNDLTNLPQQENKNDIAYWQATHKSNQLVGVYDYGEYKFIDKRIPFSVSSTQISTSTGFTKTVTDQNTIKAFFDVLMKSTFVKQYGTHSLLNGLEFAQLSGSGASSRGYFKDFQHDPDTQGSGYQFIFAEHPEASTESSMGIILRFSFNAISESTGYPTELSFYANGQIIKTNYTHIEIFIPVFQFPSSTKFYLNKLHDIDEQKIAWVEKRQMGKSSGYFRTTFHMYPSGSYNDKVSEGHFLASILGENFENLGNKTLAIQLLDSNGYPYITTDISESSSSYKNGNAFLIIGDQDPSNTSSRLLIGDRGCVYGSITWNGTSQWYMITVGSSSSALQALNSIYAEFRLIDFGLSDYGKELISTNLPIVKSMDSSPCFDSNNNAVETDLGNGDYFTATESGWVIVRLNESHNIDWTQNSLGIWLYEPDYNTRGPKVAIVSGAKPGNNILVMMPMEKGCHLKVSTSSDIDSISDLVTATLYKFRDIRF